jgi:hypothetical protein
VKYIPDFYYTDHQPTICWRGSGFEFRQIRRENIGGQPVYTGILQQDSDMLFTAWWYDNGVRRTIDALDWRWDVIRHGGRYAIVNVTAANRTDLEQAVQRLLRDGVGLKSAKEQ